MVFMAMKLVAIRENTMLYYIMICPLLIFSER